MTKNEYIYIYKNYNFPILGILVLLLIDEFSTKIAKKERFCKIYLENHNLYLKSYA